MIIEIKVLDEAKRFYPKGRPAAATPLSAAMDLCAVTAGVVAPGACIGFRTGISLNMAHLSESEGAVSMGMCAVVLPRSGLGTKGLILGNSVGLIDPDYQGEIVVHLWNRLPPGRHTNRMVAAGDRIAQLLFLPFAIPELKVVDTFSAKTERGIGGFGSTGV